MSNCPYCQTNDLHEYEEASRPRPETHRVQVCHRCGGYSLKQASGRVFPLTDRTDPNADGCTRVID